MTEISIKTIEEAIINCRCPEPIFYTIATTVETMHKRERTYLRCWLNYCCTNNIIIKYKED